jgi:hypothetical protein
MRASALALRILLVWIVILIVQTASGIIVKEASQAADDTLPWFVLSSLLVAIVLAYLAMRSDWRGLRLALALSGIPLLINVTNEIDGVAFLTSTGIEWKKEFTRLFLAGALAVPFWMLIFRGSERQKANYRPFESRSNPERLLGFVVSDVLYCVLYFVAGSIVWFASSSLRDFYATQTIPPAVKVLALQLLVRGPMYVVACLILIRMIGLHRGKGALTVGIAFAILSGVVSLLIPTRIFPDAVRWAHLYEVTSSNLLFGFLVTWIWSEKRTEMSSAMKHAA